MGPRHNCPPEAAAQPGESLRLREGRADGDNGKSGD
jgi:hypothetical protein